MKDWNDQLLLYSRDRLTGALKDHFSIIKKMAHALNPQITEEKIRDAVAIRKERFAQILKRIPEDNIRLLYGIKKMGKKIALLSNADTLECEGWDNSPIRDFFDVTVFSCHVGYAKPDKEIYDLVLNRCDELPQDAVFIGDGGSNELQAAKALGISTIFVSGIMKEFHGHKIAERKAVADIHVEWLKELLL
jgi:putative hydrolase of the HAD superfamily